MYHKMVLKAQKQVCSAKLLKIGVEREIVLKRDVG